MAVFAVPVLAQGFYRQPVLITLIPTIAVICLLLVIMFWALGNVIASKRAVFRKATTYMTFLFGIFFVLAITSPVWYDLLLRLSSGTLSCGAGTEVANVNYCGADPQYECLPFDQLGGQACDSSNYTLCKFGCVCPGKCLRHWEEYYTYGPPLITEANRSCPSSSVARCTTCCG